MVSGPCAISHFDKSCVRRCGMWGPIFKWGLLGKVRLWVLLLTLRSIAFSPFHAFCIYFDCSLCCPCCLARHCAVRAVLVCALAHPLYALADTRQVSFYFFIFSVVGSVAIAKIEKTLICYFQTAILRSHIRCHISHYIYFLDLGSVARH